ncbi:hypothetical protein Hanom_Chr05g00430591 [Helianthus anomalus]
MSWLALLLVKKYNSLSFKMGTSFAFRNIFRLIRRPIVILVFLLFWNMFVILRY